MSVISEIQRLDSYLSREIIGQKNLINRLLIALLADGHLLVEGPPGLAKTRAIKVLSEGLDSGFHRVQFTPDLLPADLTGTDIYQQQEGNFIFQQGPLFNNLILADEINRAPAKVQSALLEAMAERQITVGKKTYVLPELFLVMATQNPIEQEGTYPLPEAQLDRFLMHVKIDYPNSEEELRILHLVKNETKQSLKATQNNNIKQDELVVEEKIKQHTIFLAREEVLSLHMAENVEQYLLQIVMATRNPGSYSANLAKWLQYGASPRASIALDRCSRAHAWLEERDYVSPDDIQVMAHEILRHRLILNYEAEAEGMTIDDVISELISYIAVP